MSKKYSLNLQEIGERLRSVREKLNMTLEGMHEISGFSKSLISAAEKGQKKPSAIYLGVLLDRFDVDINFILSGEGGMFRSENRDGGGNEFEETYREMLFLMERAKMVRYAMMSNFLIFKSQNKATIDAILEETGADGSDGDHMNHMNDMNDMNEGNDMNDGNDGKKS